MAIKEIEMNIKQKIIIQLKMNRMLKNKTENQKKKKNKSKMVLIIIIKFSFEIM